MSSDAHYTAMSSGPPSKAAPRPTPTAVKILCVARAEFAYQPGGDEELGFPVKAMINVLQQEGDWWRGELGGKVGWFPSHFVSVVEGAMDAASASGAKKGRKGKALGGHITITLDTTGKAPVPSSLKSSMQSQIKQMSDQVISDIKTTYKQHIRPVEELYKFGEFHSPSLEDSDFDAPPMVLLMGQYSVGKTSFIEYMLERAYPGQRIGPEPTTDRFCAVMHGSHDKVTPGNASAMDSSRPFRALNKFGSGFLSRFEVAQCPSPILEDIFFVDTPGVLSGEKQRMGRSYDFPSVIEWFAARADRILLLFDAHKLDISDEFKSSIEALRGHDDKIRIVLNKADTVSNQQLLRVYGSLMWSLSRVIKSPESLRVYVSSFWDKPYSETGRSNAELFDKEARDLLEDLRGLPRNAAVRKINELIKRARLAKVHALVIAHLKSKMPSLWGKGTKQKQLLENLIPEFKEVMRRHQLPPGDFPNPDRFRSMIEQGGYEIAKFPSLKEKLLAGMDRVLANDIPQLMHKLPGLEDVRAKAEVNEASANPFGPVSGQDAAQGWAIDARQKMLYDKTFATLPTTDGKATGAVCAPALMASGLDQQSLSKVWTLSDIDKDGCLDQDEFALAMWLVDGAVKRGEPVPDTLPESFIPPSKRH
eukprot:g3616.t1